MLTFINIFLILDFSIQFDGEWPICSSAQEAKADGIKLQVTEPKQHDTRGAYARKIEMEEYGEALILAQHYNLVCQIIFWTD